GGVYRARAIRVMRQLDEQKVDYVALIEEELWRKRGALKKVAPVVPGCPQCGTINDADAIFCKKCAHRLIAAAGHA
ncbi:MAG: zinc ribbon domain-containing protein, partial [Polyangia bacterium]